MEDKNFEQQMEALQTPSTGDIRHHEHLKITLLNAKRSSQAGILFIIIPSLFLLGVFIKYTLGINLNFFNSIEDKMAAIDKVSSLKWIAPLLLVGLPLISIVMNSLAIMHFYWDKQRKEFIITIKYKLLNVILLLLSIAIVGIFLLYAITENMHHFSE